MKCRHTTSSKCTDGAGNGGGMGWHANTCCKAPEARGGIVDSQTLVTFPGKFGSPRRRMMFNTKWRCPNKPRMRQGPSESETLFPCLTRGLCGHLHFVLTYGQQPRHFRRPRCWKHPFFGHLWPMTPPRGIACLSRHSRALRDSPSGVGQIQPVQEFFVTPKQRGGVRGWCPVCVTT